MQIPRKMSAQNVMASISRTLGNNRDNNKSTPVNEVRLAGDERKDKLYEPKHKQKLIRVLTVVAYVIFVSMAAILLSLYYTFLWDPKDQSVRMVRVNKPECEGYRPLNDHLPLVLIAQSNETQFDANENETKIPSNSETSEATNTNSTTQRSILKILQGGITPPIFSTTSTTSTYENFIQADFNDTEVINYNDTSHVRSRN